MNITLVHPRFAEGYRSPAVMVPLAPAVLAALTPPRHTVRFHDERLADLPADEPTDLVGISTCTFAARRAYQIADAYRARGTKVVLGGFHPTLMPDEAGEHADSVVTGDAEFSWPQVVADAEAGCLRRRYGPSAPGPAVPVAPDHRIFHGMRYLPIHPVQFGRGCPRNCEFCSIRAFYGGGTATRPVESVVEELRDCGKRRVMFVDDNLFGDRAAFVSLLDAITPLRLRWTSQIDIRVADDPALLERVRRSGCESLVIGLESLEESNLRQMGKAWNRAAEYSVRLERIRKAGILVYGTFVFGYDGDTPETIARTLEFALRERLYIANFNPLQPLPGTPLYQRCEREGRLVSDRWWLDPAYRWHEALIEPRGMTRAELTDGCRHARETFHSLSNILRRLPSSAHLRGPSNLLLYLAGNWISRRDIAAKSKLAAATR